MDIYEIKINGVIEIDQPIDSDTEYSIALERIQQKDGMVLIKENNQESKTFQYKMVNLGIATLLTEGKVIKGKAKSKSQSRALRYIIEKLWNEQYSAEIDKETFYNQEMSKIIDEYNKKLI